MALPLLTFPKLRSPIAAVRNSVVMDRKRGISLGSKIDELHAPNRLNRTATISGPSTPPGSGSGYNSPREKRVTLLVGEIPGMLILSNTQHTKLITGESRSKQSNIPKDKMEKRPSAVVTPRKEKLVREESLVNIEL